MSKLMPLTPFYKSGYWWLGLLAYFICTSVNHGVFQSNWIGMILSFVLAGGYVFWLAGLARNAQLEADWELPKVPRIPVE